MAQRFYDQASQQLAPIYDQQQKAIQSQIPAIQNLYNTLNQGLQTSYDTQLSSGVNSIVEDASTRGVLRSTLPVDARQALTTQLSQALLQGKAELGSKQAGELAGINERLGTLNINRVSAITDLAKALEQDDMARQQFEWQKQMDERNYQLQVAAQRTAAQRASGGGSRGGSATDAQRRSQAASALASEMRKLSGSDGYVSPATWAAARREWGAAGYVDFDRYFGGFKNPNNKNYN